MSAAKVVYALLNGVTSAADRIYPLLLPQESTYPAVTYQQISGIVAGAMGADSPIKRVRIQVNSWGSTYAEAKALAGEVDGKLRRWRGIVEGVKVLDILQLNELDEFESATGTRRVIQDYQIIINEGA